MAKGNGEKTTIRDELLGLNGPLLHVALGTPTHPPVISEAHIKPNEKKILSPSYNNYIYRV